MKSLWDSGFFHVGTSLLSWSFFTDELDPHSKSSLDVKTVENTHTHTHTKKDFHSHPEALLGKLGRRLLRQVRKD